LARQTGASPSSTQRVGTATRPRADCTGTAFSAPGNNMLLRLATRSRTRPACVRPLSMPGQQHAWHPRVGPSHQGRSRSNCGNWSGGYLLLATPPLLHRRAANSSAATTSHSSNFRQALAGISRTRRHRQRHLAANNTPSDPPACKVPPSKNKAFFFWRGDLGPLGVGRTSNLADNAFMLTAKYCAGAAKTFAV
jgi:hypothetical protein